MFFEYKKEHVFDYYPSHLNNNYSNSYFFKGFAHKSIGELRGWPCTFVINCRFRKNTQKRTHLSKIRKLGVNSVQVRTTAFLLFQIPNEVALSFPFYHSMVSVSYSLQYAIHHFRSGGVDVCVSDKL